MARSKLAVVSFVFGLIGIMITATLVLWNLFTFIDGVFVIAFYAVAFVAAFLALGGFGIWNCRFSKD